MKVYGKNSSSKSWALQLNALSNAEASLDAVDSKTGDKISSVIDFCTSGRVVIVSCVKEILEDKGYDPYEHGNDWTSEGSLIMFYSYI